MLIIKKGGNDWFRLALFKLLLPVKIKRGNVMEKKKRKEKKRGQVGEMVRRLKANYIQPQEAVPLFTKERLKGSNIKGLKYFEVIQGM